MYFCDIIRVIKISKEIKYLFASTTFFSLVIFHEVWLALVNGQVPGGGEGDTGQVLWWLKINADAIYNRDFLLFTDAGNFPSGINALWNQSILGFSILLAPITKLANPVLSYNMLVIALPFLSTFGLWYLLKTLGKENRIFWSLLYGFGPLVPLHILGHINIATLGLLPLIVAFIYRYINNGKVRDLVTTLFLIIFQFFTSSEILLLTAILALVVLLLELKDKKNFLMVKRSLYLVFLSTIALLYPIYYFLRGAQSIDGPVQDSDLWKNDLLTFLFPPNTSLLHFDNKVNQWGNAHEALGYLGVFLLGYLLFFTLKKGGNFYYPVLIVVFYILSLGPTLHSSIFSSNFSLPYKLIDNIPVVSNALPARLSILTFLLMILYLSSKDFTQLLTKNLKFIIPGALFASLLMAPLVYNASEIIAPKAVSSDAFCKIAAGRNVYIVPLARPGFAGGMLWQATCKAKFNTYGTYNIIQSEVYHRKPTWSNYGILDLVALKTKGVDVRGSGVLQVNKEALLKEVGDKNIQIIAIESSNTAALSLFNTLFGENRKIADVLYWEIN